MKYRLFVSDFDGTLVRADGTVSQKNIRAIAKYREAGGLFAVCTGRMLSSIRPRLKELGLEEGLVVAYQGAQIADIGSGALLRDAAFSEQDAMEVLLFMESLGLHLHVYVGEKLYANKRDELLEIYERICKVKAEVSEGKLSDMVASKHMRIVKILAMHRPEEQARIKEELQNRFHGRFFVTASSDWLVEVMPHDQTKGQAIAFLSEKYAVPKEEIAAIGDQENDLPMLRAAGGKFAVANAVEALRREAVVVPSCEDDGVAYAIERYAMGEEG